MFKGWTYEDLKDSFQKPQSVILTDVQHFSVVKDYVGWSGMYKRAGNTIVIMYDSNSHAFLNDDPPIPAGLKVIPGTIKIYPYGTVSMIFSWQIEGWTSYGD